MTTTSHFNMAYNKYRNQKTRVDGILFDSKKEANRYCELKMLCNAGIVKNLELQPKFKLCDSVVWNSRKYSAKYYIADFKYIVCETGITVVEDCKGAVAQLYALKRHIFISKYPEYEFIET